MSKHIESMRKSVPSFDISTDTSTPAQAARVFCGIDVSRASLAVAVFRPNQPIQQREFPNSASGHKALIAWLGKFKTLARVSLEATGIYSMDLALALDTAVEVEVAVVNPKRAHDFAKSLGRRSKSDKADAQVLHPSDEDQSQGTPVLAEFSMRMEFLAWQRPSQSALQLRAVSRHIEALGLEHTRAMNRLHAAQGAQGTPRCVLEDLKRSLAGLERRMVKMRRAGRKLIDSDEQTREQFRLLLGMPGIAEVSALQILGELVLLSPELKARQWVARSGLDPMHEDSGSSVHKPSRISRAGSRQLRRALYMPALSAVRCDPHLKAFYEALLARHKKKLQALMAVARKMLHAIYAIFKSRMAYDGSKLFPQLKIA